MNSDLKLVKGAGAPPSLPVFATFKMALGFVAQNFVAILKVSAIPALLMFAALTLSGTFDIAQEPGPTEIKDMIAPLVNSALMAIIMAAVGRMVLFGQIPQDLRLPSFGPDETRTWAASLIASLITSLAAGLSFVLFAGATSNTVGAVFVAVFLALGVTVLLVLIYPYLLAVGQLNLRRPVEMAKGSFPQLLALVLLTAIFIIVIGGFGLTLVFSIASMVSGAEGPDGQVTALTLVAVVVLQVLMVILNTAVISFAFRWIDYYSPEPLLKEEQEFKNNQGNNHE